MKNIEIKINKRTRKVECKNSFLGNELENLQENLIFTFDDEFVDGIGRLEYEINHQKNYFILEKVGESYTIPVKNVLTVGGRVYSQLVITEEETEKGIPVFKSNVFYLYVKESLNAVNEAPEGYELWIETANQKLLELENAMTQIDNLDISSERVSDGVEITITKKDGSTETSKVNDGEQGEQGEQGIPGINGQDGADGQDAKINGYNTITIQAGNNIILDQEDDIFTISATGDISLDYNDLSNKPDYNVGDSTTDILRKIKVGDEVYEVETGNFNELTNRPSYNGTVMSGSTNIPVVPTKTSDLTNDSGFIDSSYHDSTKQNVINTSNKLPYSYISGTPTIPTNVSALTNDAGYITNSYHDSTKQNTISSTNKIPYTYISGTPTIPSKTSDLTNDSGFLTEHQNISGKVNVSDIINDTSHTDTNKPLSANMGKEIQDQIDNLKSRGRFLSLWNCTTGLATTIPTENPYSYKTGDYFIISVVGDTNYKPNGSTYDMNDPSTSVETREVNVDDVYYYDGTNWDLQINTQKTVGFANLSGSPTDNTNLASALNSKQNVIDSTHKLSYSYISGTPTIPTNVSSLNNDAGYITSSYHDNTKQDVINASNRIDYSYISDTPIIPNKTSQLTNDSGYLTLGTLPIYNGGIE